MLRAGRLLYQRNDVVHLTAAHLLGRGLPHDPPQAFYEVRFSTPIGTYDAGHARLNGQLRRVKQMI